MHIVPILFDFLLRVLQRSVAGGRMLVPLCAATGNCTDHPIDFDVDQKLTRGFIRCARVALAGRAPAGRGRLLMA